MSRQTASAVTRIRAYQIDLPLREGRYAWSGGNAVEVFDATVVAIDTAGGLTGWGEICPLGPAYLPAYAAGARAWPNSRRICSASMRVRSGSSTRAWTAPCAGIPT